MEISTQTVKFCQIIKQTENKVLGWKMLGYLDRVIYDTYRGSVI